MHWMILASVDDLKPAGLDIDIRASREMMMLKLRQLLEAHVGEVYELHILPDQFDSLKQKIEQGEA